MSQPIDINGSAPAQDFFVRYFTEKMWAWIPAEYKLRDTDGVLRGLIQVMAQQAAVSRRGTDRLWENQYIEFCDDWAVPLIGDLVATRMLNPLNRRGRRVDVAKTIFYRRRKGTPFVIDTLIRDVTGWGGVVVEAFKRLHREYHGLDPMPAGRLGPVTGTPPGGWPDLRSPRASELVGGPFDEFFYTPDVRRHRGSLGRMNIPKVNLHLYRIPAYEVRWATPRDFGDYRYTFDPSGRDIELYRPNQRPEPDEWEPAKEWQINDKIPCRLLNEWNFEITSVVVDALVGMVSDDALDSLRRYLGETFVSETRLNQTLASVPFGAELVDPPVFEVILETALNASSPKPTLWGRQEAVVVAQSPAVIPPPPIDGSVYTDFDVTEVLSANLEQWGDSFDPVTFLVDPCRGRFRWRVDTTPPSLVAPVYHYGLPGNRGAGTYTRRDSIVADAVDILVGNPPGEQSWTVAAPPTNPADQFVDSQTYVASDDIADIDNWVLQADDQQRPYVVRDAASWSFTALVKSSAEDVRTLELDGLWIGLRGAVPSETPSVLDLILDGVWDKVVVRNCTLDPGGLMAEADSVTNAIPCVRLNITGTVDELVIENSIVGAIFEVAGDHDPCSVERLVIRDSIVHALNTVEDPEAPGTPLAALRIPRGEVCLERTTVFGDVFVNRMFATEAIIQGQVVVDDNQHGCFRFSASSFTDETRLPPQFESHRFEPAIPNHFFTSRRFGDPGYAQLSQTAPLEIVRGAENAGEMGVYSSLINPIKFDDLRTKVDEYLPFGLIPQYIFET